jgi:alkaline phosphatase
MLEGVTSDHDNEMAPLAMNECGFPLEFNPLDFEADGGNMVLWDNVKGGEYPWDANYYTSTPDLSSGFDPEYIIQHATDSAITAATLATGTKGAAGMLSQTLYEEKVSTLLEDAVMCGKGGGAYSTVPMFHATPAAFVIHSNNRSDRDKLRKSFLEANPTMISGVCAGRYYPAETTLESMTNGALSGEWTFLSQSTDVLAEVSRTSSFQELEICLGNISV